MTEKEKKELKLRRVETEREKHEKREALFSVALPHQSKPPLSRKRRCLGRRRDDRGNFTPHQQRL